MLKPPLPNLCRFLASTALALTLLAGCGAPSSFSGHGQAGLLSAQDTGVQSFPQGFMWGVATAGYQYEGGDTTSNWAEWVNAGHAAEPIAHAVDDWNRYKEDIDLAKALGLNSYRLSIEWARIEPQEGVFDQAAIQHYHDVLAAIQADGMTPIVTVSHFAYPAWLDKPDAQGKCGWESDRMPTEMAQYAAFVAKEYGSQIKYYLTLNEPNTLGICGYLAGVFPPGKHDPLAYETVMNNQVKAHKLMYAAIHQNDPDAMVSINPIVIHRQEQAANYGRMTAEGFFYIDPESTLDQLAPVYSANGQAAATPRYLDYMAFNYFYSVTAFDIQLLTHYDQWPVYPQGIYEVAKELYTRYHMPLMVTENGVATHGDSTRPDGWTRSAYIVNHLIWLKKAMDEGIPVLGYMHWSLEDNYEWGSYDPHFGLYAIDRRDTALTRMMTQAAYVYRTIATDNGLPQSLVDRYNGKRD